MAFAVRVFVFAASYATDAAGVRDSSTPALRGGALRQALRFLLPGVSYGCLIQKNTYIRSHTPLSMHHDCKHTRCNAIDMRAVCDVMGCVYTHAHVDICVHTCVHINGSDNENGERETAHIYARVTCSSFSSSLLLHTPPPRSQASRESFK